MRDLYQFERGIFGVPGEHTVTISLDDPLEVFAAALNAFEALISGAMGGNLFWGPMTGGSHASEATVLHLLPAVSPEEGAAGVLGLSDHDGGDGRHDPQSTPELGGAVHETAPRECPDARPVECW